MLVEETAKRLVPATCAGDRPRNVRTGEIIIPPPTPTMDPKMPAINPINAKKGKRKNSSKSNTYLFLYDCSNLINCLQDLVCNILVKFIPRY